MMYRRAKSAFGWQSQHHCNQIIGLLTTTDSVGCVSIHAAACICFAIAGEICAGV
jgi:hypothetical protein